MGASSSLILSPESSDGSTHPSKLKLGDIPESCIALVLSYLDPPEICKLARLNRSFRAASSADFIWEDKLPVNYRSLVDGYLINNNNNNNNRSGCCSKLGKSEIYSRLTKPVRFDDGNKEFWLDKRTGGMCLSISSMAMNITGIDDRRYWNIIPTNESRFRTIAYLHQIWWLEVGGDIEFRFPAGTYSLLFKLRLGRFTKTSNRQLSNHVHGWDIKPAQFQLSTPEGQHAVSKCFLEKNGIWEYHHVGDFMVDDSSVPTNVKYSLTQIDCTHTKGGLSVDSVLICPSNLVKDFKALL
ncbi:F-box protein PP2-A13-like [Bidens hawaiensis]|uniref:F-box protein PP2-A13-like n=1 Tax=Bidens hawaiensis TaxID=980011 RepID=UPI00404949FC